MKKAIYAISSLPLVALLSACGGIGEEDILATKGLDCAMQESPCLVEDVKFNSDFSRFKFNNVIFKNVEFVSGSISGAKFEHSKFEHVVFNGAVKSFGVSFEHSQLEHVSFPAKVNNINGTEHKLPTERDLSIVSSNISHSLFEGDIKFSRFYQVNSELVDFENTNLSLYHFDASSMKQVKFENSVLVNKISNQQPIEKQLAKFERELSDLVASAPIFPRYYVRDTVREVEYDYRPFSAIRTRISFCNLDANNVDLLSLYFYCFPEKQEEYSGFNTDIAKALDKTQAMLNDYKQDQIEQSQAAEVAAREVAVAEEQAAIEQKRIDEVASQKTLSDVKAKIAAHTELAAAFEQMNTMFAGMTNNMVSNALYGEGIYIINPINPKIKDHYKAMFEPFDYQQFVVTKVGDNLSESSVEYLLNKMSQEITPAALNSMVLWTQKIKSKEHGKRAQALAKQQAKQVFTAKTEQLMLALEQDKRIDLGLVAFSKMAALKQAGRIAQQIDNGNHSAMANLADYDKTSRHLVYLPREIGFLMSVKDNNPTWGAEDIVNQAMADYQKSAMYSGDEVEMLFLFTMSDNKEMKQMISNFLNATIEHDMNGELVNWRLQQLRQLFMQCEADVAQMPPSQRPKSAETYCAEQLLK